MKGISLEFSLFISTSLFKVNNKVTTIKCMHLKTQKIHFNDKKYVMMMKIHTLPRSTA